MSDMGGPGRLTLAANILGVRLGRGKFVQEQYDSFEQEVVGERDRRRFCPVCRRGLGQAEDRSCNARCISYFSHQFRIIPMDRSALDRAQNSVSTYYVSSFHYAHMCST